MVITQTPFRMSFFGGGTDLQDYFSRHGGSVLSTTFNRYCYVSVRHLPRFFAYSNEIIYSRIERVSSVDEIEHPLVRNTMKYLDMHELRLTYDADLPARSGLGTSSSFAVGLLQALYALKGRYVSRDQLARDAIYIERVLNQEAGGWQDQIAAAYGGFNRINFHDDTFEVEPLILSPDRKQELNRRLMLFFTGFTRMSSEIQRDVQREDPREREKYLMRMQALVDDAQSILVDRDADLHRFGELLDLEWSLKRQTGSRVSTDRIDALYRRGIEAGAAGGKLMGAGGGGFLLFYVEPQHQAAVREAMQDLMYVPFTFTDSGTTVLHYQPERWYQEEGVVSDSEVQRR